MKLTVKNLGPITKGGTIDLDKRFYVFVGKNGSGKTYLANLLYGVFGNYRRAFHSLTFQFTEENQSIILKKEQFISVIQNFSLKDYLAKFLGNTFPLKDNIEAKLSVSYEKDFLQRELNISFHYINQEIAFFLSKEKNSNTIYLKKETSPSILKNSTFTINVSSNLSNNEQLFQSLNSLLSRHYFHTWIYNLYDSIAFLPANRTSFLSLWKYIITAERAERDLLYKKNSEGILLSTDELKDFQALYTTPVKHLIDHLESFDIAATKETSNYTNLLQDLENIMGGKILVKEGLEGIGRKRFVFEMQENGEEIELFLASSSVNQLSLLYIYLKYWAYTNNNFLIIDEPEINLHPENQIKLLDILMKFANMNNNRVLITTHSTLMADAVNNHVRIGHLQTTEKGKSWLDDNKEWLNKNNLAINENISHNDFGVYYFDGAIKNYDVKDYGVFFKDFAEAEDKIKDVADVLKGEIYNELHPKKAQ